MKVFDKNLEAAAKAYCVRSNLDPEEYTPFNNGTMAYTTRARWKNVYGQLEALAEQVDLLKEFGVID